MINNFRGDDTQDTSIETQLVENGVMILIAALLTSPLPGMNIPVKKPVNTEDQAPRATNAGSHDAEPGGGPYDRPVPEPQSQEEEGEEGSYKQEQPIKLRGTYVLHIRFYSIKQLSRYRFIVPINVFHTTLSVVVHPVLQPTVHS